MISLLRCGGCYRKLREKTIGAFKKSGELACVKCARKFTVAHRPKGMGWREAFINLTKYGTFKPPPKNTPVEVRH